MGERDVEAGLPQFQPISVEHYPKPTPPTSCKELGFKAYVTGSAVVIWTAHSLLMRATLTGSELYLSTTVVVLAESAKWLLCVLFILRQHHGSPRHAIADIRTVLFRRPGDMAKGTVPSVLYAIQNNLDFVALANVEPAVFVLTAQLKVVTTAVFMMLLLRREFSRTRWLALLALMAGVAFVQLDGLKGPEVTPRPGRSENYVLGIACVLASCFTSAFAGVWFEKMLKASAEPGFWQRNLQLYSSGVLLSGLVCALHDGHAVLQRGFFAGYTGHTWLLVALTSGGGIYISLIMKHLDNILKTFTNAVSILAVVAGSYLLFGTGVGLPFALGSITVLASLVAYNLAG